MLPAVTKLFPFIFTSFPFFLNFPDFSDLLRRVPDASDRDKIDRAPCCSETETQQCVLLGISSDPIGDLTSLFFQIHLMRMSLSQLATLQFSQRPEGE